MDETKQKERPSSSELARTAVAERQAEAKEIAESLAGKAVAESPKPAQDAPMGSLPEIAKRESSPVADFVEFLKETKRVWLIVIGAIFGLIVLVTLTQRGMEWASKSRERRHEQAVASVTPERLIARCGQPSEDLTKDTYPILMRTMTYRRGRTEPLIFAFSRTAEDNSDWVFLSMKDENGAQSYETPEAQVAAMPCLDSRK